MTSRRVASHKSLAKSKCTYKSAWISANKCIVCSSLQLAMVWFYFFCSSRRL